LRIRVLETRIVLKPLVSMIGEDVIISFPEVNLLLVGVHLHESEVIRDIRNSQLVAKILMQLVC
jgi:hypothetical protein